MKKRKILGICSIVIAISLIAGGTLAYFTDSSEVTNVFTSGNVDILLDEAPVTRTEIENSEGAFEYLADNGADRVQENTYDTLYPGAYLPKDPTVHNEGENVAKIRVIIDITHEDELLALFPSAEAFAANFFENLNVNYGEITDREYNVVANVDDTSLEYNVPTNHRWVILEYVAHDGNLQVNGDSVVFTGINIPTALTNETFATIDNLNIHLTAYAVQAESFPGWSNEVAPGMFR